MIGQREHIGALIAALMIAVPLCSLLLSIGIARVWDYWLDRRLG